jgi:hypothetical protein
MFKLRTFTFAGLLLSAAISLAEDFQGSTQRLEYDEEPILYSKKQPEDPIARLQARIDSGEVKLAWDEKFGYLPALLEVLGVPKSSQMLVFSKTSLQRKLISPSNPRALYFNDNVYLGFIPGAPMMEVSTADPKLGGIFYSLEQEKVRKPKFERNQDCMSCHGAQAHARVCPVILCARCRPTKAANSTRKAKSRISRNARRSRIAGRDGT